jgi:hypothetical protein
MANFSAKIQTARDAGYSDEEIKRFLMSTPEAEKAKEAGYTDVEIASHFGLELPEEAEPAPAFDFRSPQTKAVADYIGETIGNIPASTLNLAQGVYETATHPAETAAALGQAAMSPVQTAKAVGGYFGERYASPLETFKQDPMGVLSDISAVAGGVGLGARLGGKGALAQNAMRLAERTAPSNIMAGAVQAPFNIAASGYDITRNMMAPRYATYLAAAEGRAPELISQLQSPANVIVPGAMPTAAQAAAPLGMTRFSALGETSRAVLPTEYAARAAEQNAARIAALQKVAKTPRTLATNIKRRADVTDAMYEQAKDAGDIVNPDPLLTHIDTVIEENAGNPRIVKEFQRAKKSLMSGVDETGAPTYHTDARVVASVIDGLKGTLENKKNKYITRQLLELKDKFIESIPGYSEAEAQFATMSRPINRMQLGKLLIDELRATMGEEAPQRAAAFVGAVEEPAPMIRKATGMKFISDLKQILTPKEFKSVNAIVDDLQREAKAVREGRLARQAGPTAADVTAQGGVPLRFNWFNRLNSFVNKVMEKAEGKINRRMAVKIAKEMLDPQQTAQALQQALDYTAQTEKRVERLKTLGAGVKETAQKYGPAISGAVTAQNVMRRRDNQNAMAR